MCLFCMCHDVSRYYHHIISRYYHHNVSCSPRARMCSRLYRGHIESGFEFLFLCSKQGKWYLSLVATGYVC